MNEEFENLIDDALIAAYGLDIYTFAFYHEHESELVSICIDTKENSEEKVEEINAYNMKYFDKIISEGCLDEAVMWQANVGRSLSLGDFKAVNIVELDVEGKETDDAFYLSMINSIKKKLSNIKKLSSHGNALLFCCSNANEEVGLVWVENDV